MVIAYSLLLLLLLLFILPFNVTANNITADLDMSGEEGACLPLDYIRMIVDTCISLLTSSLHTATQIQLCAILIIHAQRIHNSL